MPGDGYGLDPYREVDQIVKTKAGYLIWAKTLYCAHCKRRTVHHITFLGGLLLATHRIACVNCDNSRVLDGPEFGSWLIDRQKSGEIEQDWRWRVNIQLSRQSTLAGDDSGQDELADERRDRAPTGKDGKRSGKAGRNLLDFLKSS